MSSESQFHNIIAPAGRNSFVRPVTPPPSYDVAMSTPQTRNVQNQPLVTTGQSQANNQIVFQEIPQWQQPELIGVTQNFTEDNTTAAASSTPIREQCYPGFKNVENQPLVTTEQPQLNNKIVFQEIPQWQQPELIGVTENFTDGNTTTAATSTPIREQGCECFVCCCQIIQICLECCLCCTNIFTNAGENFTT